MNKNYDYLIVGAGLFGAIFAYEAKRRGQRVLVIEKRDHIGGNIYTKNIEGINVHYYGAHIFHTSDKTLWDYINQFAEFNHYVNAPIAIYHDEVYNLPFNMNTFSRLWGIKTPQEAKKMIEAQRSQFKNQEPRNLEEQAISLVGVDVYQKLIKGYTEKQWGRPCHELPSFIIKRLPVRFTYDNNYFNDRYQGIPIGGYTSIIEKMFDGIEVRLETDFFKNRASLEQLATKVVYTGPIDELLEYRYGVLEYRSLRFEHELLDLDNYQGNAVVNYTASDVPYTRIIEHKHFEFGQQPKTLISREYSVAWKIGDEPYYPVNDTKNSELYRQYREQAKQLPNYILGGRLAEYRYYDMHHVVASALAAVKTEFKE